eukprot:gene25907-biopygen11618
MMFARDRQLRFQLDSGHEHRPGDMSAENVLCLSENVMKPLIAFDFVPPQRQRQHQTHTRGPVNEDDTELRIRTLVRIRNGRVQHHP